MVQDLICGKTLDWQSTFVLNYQGICDIPPVRLKKLYKEINDYFYQLHAQTEYPDKYIDDGIYADA
jgi:hypothetical protein